jgi:hypothetical protein
MIQGIYQRITGEGEGEGEQANSFHLTSTQSG